MPSADFMSVSNMSAILVGSHPVCLKSLFKDGQTNRWTNEGDYYETYYVLNIVIHKYLGNIHPKKKTNLNKM